MKADLKVHAKRSLGQNFLVNQHIVEKILATVKGLSPKALVEIGPGLGALTEGLLKLRLPLTLIELDRRFAEDWRARGCEVLEADALQVDWLALNLPGSTVLVSNLPYQIAGRLMVEFASGPTAVTDLVLMMQREVADRVLGAPRGADYGFLSVVVQAAFAVGKVVDAGPKDFRPAPKVRSRVLHLKRRTTLDPQFTAFVKTSFQNRRKFLLKNFPAAHDAMLDALRDLGYSEKARAEELSVVHYQTLFERLGPRSWE
jgi:16S rRNA (adenine1518-N6/adenine1519-N6)-dimethyltransferase